ncbi:unnamed protein product [Acanthoscelides obtectus]|uniref:Ig-like domain-containing protein n=1 Tax=Acanthoscelides obtectus TaxID=200917 RepID=A0A9P0NUM9_ACAOB|nr:unnamed protein product [Acanthoscelides obtectus]CAK1633946.1 Muscle M-line assembly protein unc-89 [Acanthoscelides obtectus]
MPVGSMDRKKMGEVKTIPKIVTELRDIRCCDGDSATLECVVEANPPPDIRWEKAGKLIHLGSDFNADFDGETAKLSIRQVYPEDEGEYTCVAYNELGKAFTSSCLVVDLPEEKDTLLQQQLRRPAGLLDTPTPSSTPRSTPIRSVSPHIRRREVPPPSATSPVERVRRIRATAPKFYARPHDRVAEEGETVRFQCAVAGHPDPWVIWEKDGQTVTPTARIKITEKEDLRILEISEVTTSDSGSYRVILENDVGRTEASARLDVIRHRPYSSRGIRARSLSPRTTPFYSRGLMGTTALLGSRARLYCDLRASPSPSIRWYRDGVALEDTTKYRTTYDGKTAVLEIERVNKDDAGIYTCVAKNKNGAAETVGSLVVNEFMPPEILEDLPRNVSVIEGTPVNLKMKVRGNPPYDVIWSKDDCILPVSSGDFKQTVDQEKGIITMRISDAHGDHSGKYRCEVYNLYGDAASTSLIDVHGELAYGIRP